VVTEATDGAVSRDDLLAALVEAHKRIEQLETALRSRVVIEQAKGVLRERFGWSLEDAFEVLRSAARSSRVRLHVVAEAVVASKETPLAVTTATARNARLRAAHLHEYAEAQQERAARLLDDAHDQRRRFEQRPRRER
jgi:hypothetical protein